MPALEYTQKAKVTRTKQRYLASSQRQRGRQMRSIKLLYESQKFYIITRQHQAERNKKDFLAGSFSFLLFSFFLFPPLRRAVRVCVWSALCHFSCRRRFSFMRKVNEFMNAKATPAQAESGNCEPSLCVHKSPCP